MGVNVYSYELLVKAHVRLLSVRVVEVDDFPSFLSLFVVRSEVEVLLFSCCLDPGEVNLLIGSENNIGFVVLYILFILTYFEAYMRKMVQKSDRNFFVTLL